MLTKLLIIIVGYVCATYLAGAVINKLLHLMIADSERQEISELISRGLKNAGKYIGWLERFLVVTLVLHDNYTAIGFVLATKGIIRFGEIKEAKDQRIAEYVLIGTMLSFSIAITIGLAMVELLH